jgi:hypothetical protein
MTFMGSNGEKPHQYTIEKIFTTMRNVAFNVKPAQLNIIQERPNQIYGIFMETGYEEVVFSLRCFAEGSISIYISNGSATIGIGEHENARKSGLDFIKEAEIYIAKSELTTDNKLPNPGQTIFYILTFDGIFTHIDIEEDLGTEKSEFSPLFYKAHDVINQARILDEKREKEK